MIAGGLEAEATFHRLDFIPHPSDHTVLLIQLIPNLWIAMHSMDEDETACNNCCMSKKYCPILHRKLLNKMGQDFSDILYSNDNKLIIIECFFDYLFL